MRGNQAFLLSVAALVPVGCGRARYATAPDANIDVSTPSMDVGLDGPRFDTQADASEPDANRDAPVPDAFSTDDAFAPDAFFLDDAVGFDTFAIPDAYVIPDAAMVDAFASGCDLLVNASFESPVETDPMGFEELPRVPDGWSRLVVYSDPNDNPNIHHDRFPAVMQGDPPDGHQAVDLNGWQPNGLAQYVALTPGTSYRLSLLHARNPSCGSASSRLRITIREGGASCTVPSDCPAMTPNCVRGRCTVRESSMTFTAAGNFNNPAMWSEDQVTFTPTESTVEIVLEGTEATACGPVIDYVYLGTTRCAVPAPFPR